MQRIVFYVLVLGVSWCCSGLALAQEPPRPVEEWQIKGIQAGLEDGYPDVRRKAALKLALLLGDDDASKQSPRDWNDHSRQLAGQTKGTLLKLLKDSNAAVRLIAAEALARLSKQTAPEFVDQLVPQLVILLGDDDPGVRAEAAAVIGRLGKGAPVTKAVPNLIKLLQDRDANVQKSAAQALGFLIQEAAPELIRLLRNKDPNVVVKKSTADVLGRLGVEAEPALRKEAIQELATLLNDPDNSVQQAAASALGRIGKEAVPVFVELLRDPNVQGVVNRNRWLAVDALSRLGNEAAPDIIKAAMPKLVECLGDPIFLIRKEAADVLGLRCKDWAPEIIDNAVPKIAALLKDTDEGVKRSAMMALARLGEAGMPAFSELLKKDDAVALAALEVLDNLGNTVDPKLLEKAEPFLENTQDTLKVKAASVWGRLGARAKPKLLKLLDGNDLYVKQRTIEILLRMGKEAAPELVELLTSPDRDLQASAASALAALAYKLDTDFIDSAAPTLIKLVKDPATPLAVKASAATVLGYLGPKAPAERRQEVAQELVNFLKGSEKKDKAAAAEPLGRLSKLLPPGFLKKETVSDFIEILKVPFTLPPLTVVETLGRLGTEADAELVKSAVSVLVKLHTDLDGFPLQKEKAEEALWGLLATKKESVLIRILEMPYENSNTLPHARWLAHYLGGGDPAVPRHRRPLAGQSQARPADGPAVLGGKARLRAGCRT